MLDEMTYIILKLEYIKKMKSRLANPEDEMQQRTLFPNEWDYEFDYNTRSDILTEAIKNNILIEETDTYNKLYGKGIYI